MMEDWDWESVLNQEITESIFRVIRDSALIGRTSHIDWVRLAKDINYMLWEEGLLKDEFTGTPKGI